MVRVTIVKLFTWLIFSSTWFIIGYYVHDFQMSKVKLKTTTSNRLLQSDGQTNQRTSQENDVKTRKKPGHKLPRCRGQRDFAINVPQLDTKIWDKVKLVVLFIGYERSGHSLIGSLLDAHPNIVIADELHTVKTWQSFPKEDRTRNNLFQAFYSNSYKMSQRGERSSKNCISTLGGYKYQVPNQWQGRFDKNIQVIGDKDGSKAVRDIALNPYIKDVFPQLQKAVNLPFKYIHVVRNPFDIIATMILQHISRDPISSQDRKKFFLNPFNASKEVQEHWAKYHETYTGGAVKLLKRFGDDVITIFSEEMIENPSKELKRLCEFLSVSCSADYLKDCSSIVNASPSKSRYTVL